jgi:uncharacterized protein
MIQASLLKSNRIDFYGRDIMTNTSKRGFASMDEEKQREIASKGGKAAHQKGTAHEFTSEEAREAGRKGGETTSKDREFMAEIGREGGKHSRKSSHSEEENGNGKVKEDKETPSTSKKQQAKAGKKSNKSK